MGAILLGGKKEQYMNARMGHEAILLVRKEVYEATPMDGRNSWIITLGESEKIYPLPFIGKKERIKRQFN